MLDSAMDQTMRTITQADILAIMEAMELRFVTKEKFADLEDRINLLPTKEEFFSRMDTLFGEVNAERDENEIQRAQLANHDQRISTIETKLHY